MLSGFTSSKALPLAVGSAAAVAVAALLRCRRASSARPHRSINANSDSCLVVWDFDYSLIDANSDTFVVKQLAPTLHDSIDQLYRERFSGQWTALMDHLLGRLSSEHGVGREALLRSLETVPMTPEHKKAVGLAGAAGAEQRILSDANDVFIQTILEAKQISAFFSETVTNPASWDSSGALRVQPYVKSAHGCPRCPPNLCKGQVLDKWLSGYGGARPRVVYVGDGGGDVCPSLRLGEGDFVCARAGCSLHEKLKSSETEPKLRASLLSWHDGPSLLGHFEDLFQRRAT